ncbi:MAG: YihA family ribosome biogenesis GTP-binding protein [Alphaproteobacteria bacterium]|nr:YihA family ribosome biogenesis GTP-binding protein [Alphaproteobacteria bacterium]
MTGEIPDDERAAHLEATRLEEGRLLFAKECTFLLGVAQLDQLPPGGLPEVAFAGRSNVGKSSLINALTGRLTLARTSNTPGRTQQINFFDLGGRLMLIDLPGYGFAQAPKQQVRQWTRLVDDYLRGRVELRRVCLLIDSRHGLKPPDLAVMAMLDKAAVTYQIVLTKADKIGAQALAEVHGATLLQIAKRTAAYPLVLATSSEKGAGIPELRAELAALASSA